MPGDTAEITGVFAATGAQFGNPAKPSAHWLQAAPANPVLHTQSPELLQVPLPLHVVVAEQNLQFG
jgi:hypothetical protein